MERRAPQRACPQLTPTTSTKGCAWFVSVLKKISVLFTVFRYPCRSHGQSGRQRGTDHLNITGTVALDRPIAHLFVVDLDLVAVLGRAHIVLEVGRGRGRHMAAGLGLQRHQVIGSELLQRALGLFAQVAEKDITM